MSPQDDVFNKFQSVFYNIRKSYDDDTKELRVKIMRLKKRIRVCLLNSNTIKEDHVALINEYGKELTILAEAAKNKTKEVDNLLTNFNSTEQMLILKHINPYAFFKPPNVGHIFNVLCSVLSV